MLSGRALIRNSQVAAELGYLDLPRSAATENDRWQDLPEVASPFSPPAAKASRCRRFAAWL